MTTSVKNELTRARLLMLGSLVMILVLFGLDVRDLYYKLHMLGPYDSYSFRTAGYDTIQSHPIPRPNTTIEMLRNGSVAAASGWPSFYSRCTTMYASGTESSRFFLTTRSHNCRVDISANESRIVPQVVITSSIRVDAMAWVACQLLFVGRRPSICQEAIVIGFNERYMLEEETPTYAEMAQPDSDEEGELLRFLEMVSYSYPLNHITCVEGFQLGVGEKGVFRSTIFGCGSPNFYRSEWLGFVHKGVARFLVTKGWLTADILAFMGIKYGIRQNSIDIYDVSYSSTGKMILTSSSLVNFSSFGHLYAISVLIDILLLFAHCLSTFEVLKWILLPQYIELQAWMQDFEATSNDKITAPKSVRKGFLHKIASTLRHLGTSGQVATQSKYAAPATEPPLQNKPLVHAATDGGAVVFEEEQFYSFFSRSFYRNSHYVLLTTITQVLSWMIILPNSVIWTWSDSTTQKLQGYLSSFKCWVLIASALNLLWDFIVKIDEKRAYKFVRGTYITNPEIIAIGGIASLWLRKGIFSMSGTKYKYEKQRFYDFSSFSDGYLGYGNAYEKSQDYVTTTSLHVAWIIYKPLVHIILVSIAIIAVYLCVKYAFFYFTEREGRDILLRLLGRPARPKGSTIHIGDEDTEGTTTTASEADVQPGEYKRLPLEDALGCPIRAVSLVRNALSMEIVKNGRTFIRPSCYLDFGVMLKNGQMQTRVGFSDIFKTQFAIASNNQGHSNQNGQSNEPETTTIESRQPYNVPQDDSTDGMRADATASLRISQPESRKKSLSPRSTPAVTNALTVNASMSERFALTKDEEKIERHQETVDARTDSILNGAAANVRLPPIDKKIASEAHLHMQ